MIAMEKTPSGEVRVGMSAVPALLMVIFWKAIQKFHVQGTVLWQEGLDFFNYVTDQGYNREEEFRFDEEIRDKLHSLSSINKNIFGDSAEIYLAGKEEHRKHQEEEERQIDKLHENLSSLLKKLKDLAEN